MEEITGLIINKMKNPKINEVKARIKKILIFEYPKTFIVSKSLLFLILIMNHILEMKIIKGKILTIIPGTEILVRSKGVYKLTSKFLKNSISSNKLKIIPKQ
tara:strand:+ start:6167 stop:6472 length:306 start_codon:yes stop_codon:yes gene_type:complete